MCVSALCEGEASVLTSVSTEVSSPKSAGARERLRSSSSVASPQSRLSSDELGMSTLLSSYWCFEHSEELTAQLKFIYYLLLFIMIIIHDYCDYYTYIYNACTMHIQ